MSNLHIPNDNPVRDAATLEADVAQLVGQVYAEAPLPLRSSLLQPLLKPLGLLALASICNGRFTHMLLTNASSRDALRIEDVARIQANEVVALARFVFQVSEQAVSGLAQWLSATPGLPRSTAWQHLMHTLTVQVQRLRELHRGDDQDLLDA